MRMRYTCHRVALSSLLALLLGGCTQMPARISSADLLRGKSPREVSFVEHTERLNDGVTPNDGDVWLTDLSVVFHGAAARVVYDLGRVTPIDSAFLQGDNNDRFLLAVSDDGKSYREIWQAQAVPGAGMRPRSIAGLSAHGRFVRLTARGGDSAVSVGELMLFEKQPQPWPPQLEQQRGLTPDEEAGRWQMGLGLTLALLLALLHRRLPRWVSAAAALGAAGMGVACVWQIARLWPPPLGIGEQLRAVIAGVAMLAVLAWTVFGSRLRLALLKSVLFALALLGVACFYNFGAPWFWNASEKRLTPVHLYDMRVYFPVAKYFNELRFDGVYLASVKAYLEGENLPNDAVQRVDLRDLTNNRIVRAGDVMAQVDGVKQRFSQPRWQSFVRDMRWFWRTMGRGDYLGSMGDHGGNATPVWLAIANLLFRNADASERMLTLTALLDPLLLLLTFVCIWRSFGPRAMLLCLIVFGTTDFPMFGSDWAGSTLRFDWMATLGLGVCALRTRRYALGGALLAHAGLVRAFPAIALLFTPVPLFVFVLERLWRRRPPALSELRRAHEGLGRLVASALATSLVLIGLSCVLFGFEPAWIGWLHRIEVHTEDANTNHLGVRTVMAFDPDLVSGALAQTGVADPWAEWQRTQLATYQQHATWAFALRALFLLLCLVACRNARPEQAALLGLLLIPVFSYPANYYCHYVYLLPLLAVDRAAWLGLLIEVALLLMCVLEYFTLDNMVDVRFFWESVILLAGFGAVLVPLALSALRSGPTTAVSLREI
jgi:hypothetical protein